MHYCLILVTVLAIFLANVEGKRMKLLKHEMCNLTKPYIIKMYANIEEENNISYVTANLTITLPVIGNDVEVILSTYLAKDGEHFSKISSSKEKLCQLIKSYVGTLAYDIQKHIGMTPGTCPMQAGFYRLNKYRLDFRKLTILEFLPVGKLRVVESLQKNRIELICVYSDIIIEE